MSEMNQTAKYQTYTNDDMELELSSDESMEEDRPILYRVGELSQSYDK